MQNHTLIGPYLFFLSFFFFFLHLHEACITNCELYNGLELMRTYILISMTVSTKAPRSHNSVITQNCT